jgi:hypothetical protein
MRARVLALVMLLTVSGAAHAQWTTCLQAGVPSMNTLLTGAVYKVIAPWGAVAREAWWGTPVCTFPYYADVYIENYRCNWRQCPLWVNGLDRPVWLPRSALSYVYR